MDETLPPPWELIGLALACLALVAPRAYVMLLRLDLNHALFMTQIKKLILSGNPDRARKLCSAVARSELGRAVASVLDGWKGGMRDPQTLRERVGTSNGALRERLQRGMWYAVGGASLGVGVALLAWLRGLEGQNLLLVVVPGALAGLLGLKSELTAKRIIAACESGTDETITTLAKLPAPNTTPPGP